MRELAILTFQSLDGVMQGPSSPEEDRSGGFEAGGWAGAYWEAVMPLVMKEAMAEPYDILFGRKTYELFAAHWPGQSNDNPVARIMNGAKKYVATNTLSDLSWANSETLSGETMSAVDRLKSRDGRLIQVHGSWSLVQSLSKADLIDEYRIWTFPVVVGAGKRLFANGAPRREFELVRSRATENGVVMTIYKRIRR